MVLAGRIDWYTYSGTNLTQALIADTIPTIFSAGGAALSGASGGASGLFYGAFGGIAGATIGDLIKYEIKKNISKDMQNK